ncbi:MAG: hypothetical protein WA019_00415, partial [Candidatus Moraniibacteriota bacterium]
MKIAKVTIYFLALIIFLFSSKNVLAATCTWSGTTSTAWAIGTNWSCGVEPGSGDDVVINIASANQPVADFSGGTKTISSLSIGASAVSTLTFSNVSDTKYLIVNGDVTIGGSGTITHTANTTTQAHIVNIQATNLSIATGGKIDVIGKGFRYGSGPGASPTQSSYREGGGASYGGVGGRGVSVAAGVYYGSLTNPTDLGSGSGSTTGWSIQGVSGGGAVKLTISGTSSISGSILANGITSTNNVGGGSGGSILLTTDILLGTSGMLYANGGGGIVSSSGGGGGGRIAVYYTTDSSIISYQAYGGTGWSFGGAGTIYKKASGSAYGDLIIDNNNRDDAIDDRYIGKTIIAETITFDTVTVQNYGYLNIASAASITYSNLNWSTKGIIADNGGVFNLVSGGGNLIIPATARLMGNTARTFMGLTVDGILTHSNNTTTEQYKLNFTVNGDCSVGATGTVDVNYRGYQVSAGPGAGTAGASYGGTGGSASNSAYGNTIEPNDLGSGGSGGRGGGSVKLVVSGMTTLAGSIYAKGQDVSGGGSGGSIWLSAVTLAGTGVTISVSGGSGTTYGGGGGRIAIYYTNDLSSITYQAYGGTGTNFGGAGTIYKRDTDNTYGDLIIDNNNKNPTGNYSVGKTYLVSVNTFNNITIQNYGYFSTTPTTEVYYSTIDWTTKGVIGDNGGIFEILSGGAILTVPATAIFYENITRTFAGYTIEGFMETTVPIITDGDFNIGTVGTVTNKYNTTSQLYVVDITAANLSMATGGKIDINGKGFQRSTGPGGGNDGNSASGASYGGLGGYGSAVGPTTSYGSLTQPDDIGSGGGNDPSHSQYGGSGGGSVKLTISETSSIAGTITALGVAGTQGGGSGGSIWLTTGLLTGSGGSMIVTGGNGTNGGGGGGGRIAVYYTTDSSAISYQAYGGTGFAYGGAGTIYKKISGSAYGDLIIDNNNRDDAIDDRYIAKTYIDGTFIFDTVTIQNYGHLNVVPTTNITYSTLNWSTKGIISDNGGTFNLVSSGGNLTIPATAKLFGNTPRT